MHAFEFADMARQVTTLARRRGVAPPTFRSPPSNPLLNRSGRVTEHGVVIAIKVRDRHADEVIDDLIAAVEWWAEQEPAVVPELLDEIRQELRRNS